MNNRLVSLEQLLDETEGYEVGNTIVGSIDNELGEAILETERKRVFTQT